MEGMAEQDDESPSLSPSILVDDTEEYAVNSPPHMLTCPIDATCMETGLSLVCLSLRISIFNSWFWHLAESDSEPKEEYLCEIWNEDE